MQALVEASFLWQKALLIIVHLHIYLLNWCQLHFRLALDGISGIKLAWREWIIALPVRIIGQGLAFLHLEVDGNLFVCLSLNDIVDVFRYREFVLLIIILHLCILHVVVIGLEVDLRLH